jgi:transcription elongation factor GreA
MAATLSDTRPIHRTGDRRHDCTVELGSRVRILDPDGEEEYTIVADQESDPVLRRISNRSPLAAALLGHNSGDEVTVFTPGGHRVVRILSVRPVG